MQRLKLMFGLVFFTFWLTGFVVGRDLIVPDEYPTIQSAIDAAQPGDRVLVKPGIYLERITLKSNIIVQSTDGPDVTIIDGGWEGSVVTAVEVYNTTLSGFTITGGYADYGGGIFNYKSSYIINNCIITDNVAENDGGGIYNDESSPTITNCTFYANRTNNYHGGGIYNHRSSPEITNCIFNSNEAFGGGGIYNAGGSSPNITNCNFLNNTVEYLAGGIYNGESSPNITNCVFDGNRAHAGGGIFNDFESYPIITNCVFRNNEVEAGGGGISNFHSSPTVIDCTFENNLASQGGGIGSAATSLTVIDCVFEGNRANDSGGGIFNGEVTGFIAGCTFYGNRAEYLGGGISHHFYASPIITDCTFEGNIAGGGGGIGNDNNCFPEISNCVFYGNKAVGDGFFEGKGGGICNIVGSSPEIINCTFYRNEAVEEGGGIYSIESYPVITNSIIWGNIPNDLIGSKATYSNIGTGETEGEGNISADPQFVNPMEGDFHLKPTSPCIDAGSNAAVPEWLTTDFEGDPRITGRIVDMGADEAVVSIMRKVSGGGWIVIGRFRRTLTVDVEYTSSQGFTKIVVRYLNHSNRLNMEATEVTQFTISGNTAVIRGKCKVRGVSGFTFECKIRDTNPDFFSITIKDSSGNTVDTASGTLAGGDFRVQLIVN